MLKIFFSASLIALLSACTAFTEHRVGLEDGQLSACPEWPRCVSSDSAIPEKSVPPLAITGDVDTAWTTAKQAVSAMARTTIVEEREDYIHAEVISPWHFYTDDLELHLRTDKRNIAVRSSGRIGYYDFSVNRDRVAELRATLVERGVVASTSKTE